MASPHPRDVAPPAPADALSDPDRLQALDETDIIAASAAARLPTLDRVARLAARATRSPVAQVNLVSADAQVPAAAFVDPEQRGPDGAPLAEADADLGGAWRVPVGLDASYCRHVVERGRALVVHDTAEDPLVRDSRATRESGVRSYASVPVVTPGGLVLGTVCVVDFRPRAWTAADVDALRECATLAGEEVAARLGAAAALRESEERLRLALQAAGLGSWSLDLRTGTLTASAQSREHFGRPGDGPLSAADLDAAAHPDDRTRVRAAVASAVATDADYSVEYRVVGPDGHERWIAAHGHPVRDAAGGPLRVVGLTQDVSARHGADVEYARLLAEATAARARSEAVLASIADAFYLLDREWRFTYVNAAAEPLLQTTRERLLGRTLWEAFPGVVGSPFEGPYREAMATGRVTAAEAYFPPLGTWFDVRSYPWAGGLMVHFRDIGARKAAEAERERLLADAEAARAEAEAANKAKSEFLAVMSHELRTPLNAIGGYAELIEMGIRGPVTPQQREDLCRIQQSQRHLLGLINEVLNYAKLETGAVHFEIGDVRVREALAATVTLVAPQARAKALELATAECDPALVARADPEKLRQILVNLLSNAVKFTEPRAGAAGRVELSCVAEGARVLVRVRDTGIGIPPEKRAMIFDPFVQVRADLARPAEGTGLGLAISRDLARAMGGDVTVESELGVGSTFTLALPRG